jgi:hypothetical protein
LEASADSSLRKLEAGLNMALFGGVLAAGIELGAYLFIEVSTEV